MYVFFWFIVATGQTGQLLNFKIATPMQISLARSFLGTKALKRTQQVVLRLALLVASLYQAVTA